MAQYTFFMDWIRNNQKPIKLTDLITEAKGETKSSPVSISNAYIEKNPEVWEEVCDILGLGSAIPNESAITELEEDQYKGVFRKDAGDKPICINDVKAKSIVASFNDKELADLDGRNLVLFCPENNIWVKLTGTSSGSYDAKGHKFIPKDVSPLQECLIAVILEKMIHGKINELSYSKNYKPPMAIVRGKEKPMKANTPENQFWHWIMDSDPSKGTGICKYYQIKKPTNEDEKTDLQAELKAFADNWGPAFYSIASSNIINELKNIWIKNRANWSNAEIFHYARIDNMKKVPNIKAYLKEARCGQAKDTVDKSDIVLGFNAKVVNEHMGRALKMTADQLDTHNNLLNNWMNTQELIGISLKKPSKEGPSVAAVNLFRNEVNTTATGKNINDDYKVAVYFSDDPSECTFNSKLVKKYAEEPSLTQWLYINVNKGHEHDIHGQQVALRIGKAGTNPCNVEFYMTIPKQSAAMGKAGEAFKALDKSPEPEIIYRKNKKGELVPDTKATPKKVNLFSISDKYKEAPNDYIELANWIYEILSKSDNLASVFGYATGYPVIYIDTDTGEQDVHMSAAPYIKIS